MTSRTTSTPTQGLNRRRFLRIIAGTAGGLLCASAADRAREPKCEPGAA